MLRPLVTAVLCALAVTAAAAFDAPDQPFKDRAKKVLDGGKKLELEALVRGDSTQTAAWIAHLSENLLARDDPNDRALRDGLAEAWTGALATDFPAKLQAYLAGLDEAKKKTRLDLMRRLRSARTDFARARDAKDSLTFAGLDEELLILAGAFESEGDPYQASEAYLVLAEARDEPARGPAARLHDAWQALGFAVTQRELWACKDDALVRAKTRRDALAKRGADQPGGGAGGGAGATPTPTSTAAALNVPLAFEALEEPESFARPCFQADEVYALWPGLDLGGKGSSARFDRMAHPLALHRVGSSDLRLDVDLDGKTDGPADQKIVLTGTMHPYKTSIGPAGAQRPWAFFAVTGIDRDSYQGIAVNLQPNDQQMAVYALSAASVVGAVDGTSIRLIDDTLDGLYGSEVQSYGYAGLLEGSFQPELDSIVIGSSKRARPWSEFQEIGGRWYKVGKATPGDQMQVTPVTVETGTLKLAYKGTVPPTWVVVRGADGLKDCWFDLVEGGSKGVKVPVGRYSLAYGEVRQGKKREVKKALILPGASPEQYDVTAGGTTVVTLGAPYGFAFTTRTSGESLTIVGQSVCVSGAGGELYQRPWNCPSRPELSWRKLGTKKGSKLERMPFILDTEGLSSRGPDGWRAVWFPLDMEIALKGAEGGVEVQLTEKKHDLFGKIESEWKR